MPYEYCTAMPPVSFDASQSAPWASVQISSPKYLHGYYLCLCQGTTVLWENFHVFRGLSRLEFLAEFPSHVIAEGVRFRIYGYEVPGALACSAGGESTALHSLQELSLS